MKSMSLLKSQRGEITFGTILFFLIFIAGCYVGIKLAIPQIRAFQVKEIFRNEVGRVKTTSEAEIRRTVLEKVAEVGVKLIPTDEFEDGLIIINEEREPAVIEATFKIDVVFITGHKRTYRFHPKLVAKN